MHLFIQRVCARLCNLYNNGACAAAEPECPSFPFVDKRVYQYRKKNQAPVAAGRQRVKIKNYQIAVKLNNLCTKLLSGSRSKMK